MDVVWKYKVGDIVRVRPICKVDTHIGNIPFVGGMNAYKGKVFRIRSCVIFNNGRCGEVPAYFLENIVDDYITVGNFYFSNEMLEEIFYIPSDDLLEFLSDDD